VLRPLGERYPDSAAANYLLGEILIERDDEAGIALLQKAVRLEPELGDPARELMGGFYYRKGEHERLEALREEALVAMTVAGLEEQAAYDIDIKDSFLPSDLTPEEIEKLLPQFEAIPSLDVAYAVRKPLPGGAKFQDYMIVFPVKKMIETGKEGDLLLEAASKVEYPRHVIVYTNPQQRKPWERMLANISGSKIYERRPAAR
jgi:hypothetical protein